MHKGRGSSECILSGKLMEKGKRAADHRTAAVVDERTAAATGRQANLPLWTVIEPPITIAKSMTSRRQLSNVSYVQVVKLKSLFALINLILLIATSLWLTSDQAQAGFWTFYFPNFLRPSGFHDLGKMIDNLGSDLNKTKDNYADIQYFWGLMQEVDTLDPDGLYPEESVCSELFPLFRDMAIEYSAIDYEHFMRPLQEYYDYLIAFRTNWYPEGPKSKNVLPREWELELHIKDLELKIKSHERLTHNKDYKKAREKMVVLWKSVRRGMDNSLLCTYLKYAFRQMSEDINQFALEMNLKAMGQAVQLLSAAYKRTNLFKSSDDKAINDIAEAIKRRERFEIRS